MKQIFWGALIILFIYDIIFKKFLEKETKVHINQIEQTEQHIQADIPQEASSVIINEIKTLPKEKEKKTTVNPEEQVHLRVKYCVNHQKYFEELKKELIGHYSNLDLSGEEYPLPLPKKIISKLLFMVQMSTMVLLIAGKFVKSYLPFIPERVFTFLEEKKFMIGIINFFVMGQLAGIVNSTGAFEVSFNSSTLWSKLDVNILPKMTDLVDILTRKGIELI